MQDRTSANSMKVLLQRTAGPYSWVNRDCGGRSRTIVHVRFAPKAAFTNQDVIRRFVPKAAVSIRSKTVALLDHVVGAQREGWWDHR